MQGGAQENVRHVQFSANQRQPLIFSTVRTTVRTNNNPSTFFTQFRYPFSIWHTFREFSEKMRNLSISPIELQRITDLSLYYKVA